MRNQGNIFSWLGMKEEKDILEVSTQHIKSVLSCAKTFVELVKCYRDNDTKTKLDRMAEVSKWEHEADRHRVDMIRRISDSLITAPDREDLLKFTLTVDRIADWINGAARLFKFLEEPLPRDITDNFMKSAERILRGVEDLNAAINFLVKGSHREAIEKTLSASKLESQEDDHKQQTLEKVLTSKISTPQMLVTYNLAEHLEGITDKIEDAADFVRIVAIKTK